ncbi:hypothetical protein [Limosilactobacillus reuteri]|uniref:Uncharacterized protein n=2 Tax=Limosilactobacillus reuteri TaxID=1598 RepID=A0AB73PH12_LIMRT|nr:hypothetical protein [Limosilactobacillus reuteri]MCC4486013.1 hypothetical protein [Limosilactobacillus reuteri]MQB76092.1 hypothetical protein [Limosilactobacillus reuteri]MQB98131.1 hypothetical protein [Limosilactobacillus reuteri]OYS93691.1 hypothetical protein CBG10_07875 [Limosilactobacillus reuteri]OYS94531.1 hypothetical protein CBG15_04030 [Limosilactobacillus reuteri]
MVKFSKSKELKHIKKYECYSIDDLYLIKVSLENKVERAKIVISVVSGIIIALFFSDFGDKIRSHGLQVLKNLIQKKYYRIAENVYLVFAIALGIAIFFLYLWYIYLLISNQSELNYVKYVVQRENDKESKTSVSKKQQARRRRL